jgi:predicted enzyme related to lactoylglutathione lyase
MEGCKMSDSTIAGRFLWYDLMTSDEGASIDFYSQIVGWGATPWEEGDMPYTMWNVGKVPIGGVMALPQEVVAQGVPPHWLAYIGTNDVKATVAKAVELGGHIERDTTDIPSAGSFAVLSDPQGAVFAVYRPAGDAPGHEGPPNEGEFSWHELATTDYEAAFSFYGELFGWNKAEPMDMGELGVYQIYGRKELPLGGMFNKPAEMPGPPFWLYYIMIPDVNAGVEKIKELGGQILNGPMEVPDGDLIAQCLDPQGAAFAIHSKK